MSVLFFKNINFTAFVVFIIISVVAIVKGMQSFFLGLAVARIIASFALDIFTTSLSGPLNKACVFVIIILFAEKTLKRWPGEDKGGAFL